MDAPARRGYDRSAMAEAETDPAAEPIAPEPTKPVATAGPPAAEAGAILTIDLAALTANWRMLASRVTPSECGAVVKADGYGCGIAPVSAALARAGCRTFFVAALAEIGARPVIGSLVELAEWDAFCAASGWRGGAALHVDTGMNRLGISPEEAVALAPRVRTGNHGITLLISHLVAAQTPEHPLNATQIALFRELRAHYRGIASSLANSSGIFLPSGAHGDLVRPGAALYGINPTPGRPNPMRPVVRLQARIVHVRTVPRGATVGYDATWTARRPSRIAVAALGYADGFPRALSASDERPGAEAIVAGRRCPLAGRISMDLLAIDITRLPDDVGRRGDLATLIGDGIDLDRVGESAGTIGYEVLARLGRRYHRAYLGEA